jgi:hypothetical protein
LGADQLNHEPRLRARSPCLCVAAERQSHHRVSCGVCVRVMWSSLSECVCVCVLVHIGACAAVRARVRACALPPRARTSHTPVPKPAARKRKCALRSCALPGRPPIARPCHQGPRGPAQPAGGPRCRRGRPLARARSVAPRLGRRRLAVRPARRGAGTHRRLVWALTSAASEGKHEASATKLPGAAASAPCAPPPHAAGAHAATAATMRLDAHTIQANGTTIQTPLMITK